MPASQPPVPCPSDSTNLCTHLPQQAALLDEAKKLRATLSRSQLAVFREESASRIEVLRKLQHINDDEVLDMKGKAACEIDSADELVTIELMFNGAMADLDKHELVALVSCLVPVEKSTDDIKLTRQVAPVLAILQAAARHVAEVSRECKLEVVVDDYVESFKPALMDVVYSWSKGKSFADVCLMTSLYEGSIVRAVRRLDELMQQLAKAAAVVGDTKLAEKILESNLTIRRDIIFSASLYV
jgi:ATP-dependent RNA helicase DOB1